MKQTGKVKLSVLKDIRETSLAAALKNRRLLDRYCVLAINVMASPGAGKTSFILRTIEALRKTRKIAVIEGDTASRVDTERIRQEGVPAVQINTGGGCSLDAGIIGKSLPRLDLSGIDILFIENIGNLVCPAEQKLGEHIRLVITSFPEGDDKPLKYPAIFSDADCVVVNKIDLKGHVDFSLKTFKEQIKTINKKARIFPVSCKTGTGISNWCVYIEKSLNLLRKGP